MTDLKISSLTSGGLVQAADNLVVARAGASLKITPAGMSVLVYRYTVVGSDKASIDTGADTADAGSNDWTGGDVLEVWFIGRTDDAAARVNYNININNDTGANYDAESLGGVNATAGAAATNAGTTWSSAMDIHGSGGSASYPGVARITIPNYAGTTFFKAAEYLSGVPDATAANNAVRSMALGWRSTAAITRLKFAAQGTAKWKVGSQLLIYKRLAS